MTETITRPDLDLRDHVEPLDPSEFGKLGAHVGGGDPRFPMLRDHADSTVKVPAACHRSLRGFDYGMLGNDAVGDCVIAELYHSVQHSRATAGRKDAPAGDPALTQCTLKTYSAITGYDPAQTDRNGDNPTDQGTDPGGAYAYWQTTGILLPDGSTDKIAGTAQVLPHDGANIRRGIYEFDCVGISLALPLAWQAAKVWDVGGDPLRDPAWQPGGWGGHQTTGVSFDARQLAIVTWGKIVLISWPAIGTYGTLILVRVSRDQIGGGGKSVTGINYDSLARELPQL